MDIKQELIRYNTRNGVEPVLSPWFSSMLDKQMQLGIFCDSDRIERIRDGLVAELKRYKDKYKISNVVIGMSGGIDSALVAALFKAGGWTVTGLTLPIHQNKEETKRGINACKALGITHEQIDLSKAYDDLMPRLDEFHLQKTPQDSKASKIRKGNIRARLRMITLYNRASQLNGLVGSTDNFSELAAGFWTLHGDVGDIAPIQSLSKSWEVPALAELMGVPAQIISATPTDGLGVDAGDEAQFGFSYLQFDLVLLGFLAAMEHGFPDAEDLKIVEAVKTRIKSTGYKRINPVNFNHPIRGNELYRALQNLDNKLLQGE